jgi:hypothetical protein
MPYLKGDSPSLLETNVPAITQAYITTRSVHCLGLSMISALHEQLEKPLVFPHPKIFTPSRPS